MRLSVNNSVCLHFESLGRKIRILPVQWAFYRWLNFRKFFTLAQITLLSIFSLVESAQAPIFEDLSQSKKLPEIKPPFAEERILFKIGCYKYVRP